MRAASESLGANDRFTSALSVKPSASVTVSFTGNVPAADGLPLSSPVSALIATPAGSPVADHL